MEKRISLILTTYNCRDCFIRTTEAIEKQDYPNVQVCIADSCSTDGTLEAIREYADKSKYDVVYTSKKDKGIYDGLNNAIALTDGDYIEVMNDELLMPDALSTMMKAIEEAGEENVIGCHSDLVYANDDKVVRYWKMGQGRIGAGWMPAHPSLLLKKEVYDKYGLYNIDYICSADYEFILRILKDKGNKLAYVPKVMISMYYGGTSNAGAFNYVRSIWESLRALRQNGYHFGIFITGFRFIRVFLQFYRKPGDI